MAGVENEKTRICVAFSALVFIVAPGISLGCTDAKLVTQLAYDLSCELTVDCLYPKTKDAAAREKLGATAWARAIAYGIIPVVSTTLEGRACETCYGSGQIPTDGGPTVCSDCGGSGHLPRPDTNVEWRLREIERALSGAGDETTQAIQWLAFELRRARGALTEILALGSDLAESPEAVRLRFIANRALDMYDEIAEAAPAAKG